MESKTKPTWLHVVMFGSFMTAIKTQNAQGKVCAQATQTCLDSSDFAQVVKTSHFVDKTAFIKDIFLSVEVNMVAAPRKFGKSTNLDMIKRFLEIEIDTEGQPRNITETANYKVFKENNLEICKDEYFFRQHFGKHPVIYIDYSPLKTTVSYKDMLKTFRKIVTNTFAYHTYLVKNASIWKDEEEKETFVHYIIRPKSKKLVFDKLPFVFKWLAKLLHKRFGKKPVVLIDECDAFVYPLIFKDSEDLSRIGRFMLKTEQSLLGSNKHIDRGLMTGVLNTYRGDLADDVYDYHFLENFQFSLYYGLTEDDLDILLHRLIPDEKKRNITKDSINAFYGGYKIFNSTEHYTNIYCIWSVIYFITHNHYIINYLCTPEYYEEFKSFFKNHKVVEEINNLLEGKSIYMDLREPLYKEDVLELNDIVKRGNETSEFRKVTVPRLLYNFGYLTPIKDNNGFSIGNFKVASKEMFHELKNYITV